MAASKEAVHTIHQAKTPPVTWDEIESSDSKVPAGKNEKMAELKKELDDSDKKEPPCEAGPSLTHAYGKEWS